MSANDKIIIKIQADIANLQQQMSAVTTSLQGFQKEARNTSQVAQQLDVGIKAFSWTAFTQGALNSSTAIAQLYTSVGNLQRVQYQVRQSMVAVERAEDQLARKTLQLTKEIEKNGRGSEKAILLMNEIETATEQLANKQERLQLAQGQVNDTYILFASNVANSVFGVIQTLVGMKALLATRSLAAKVAIDQETAALGLNTTAARLNSAAHAGLITSRSGLVAGLSPMTTALGGATGAVGGLTSVLGKAGLVGSLAAAGIGIGAFVYDQIRLSDAATKTVDSMNDLSESFRSYISSLGPAIDLNEDFKLGMTDISTTISTQKETISELNVKLDELIKKRNEFLASDPQKPSLFGPSQREKAEGFSKTEADIAVTKAEIAKREKSSKVNEELIKKIINSIASSSIQSELSKAKPGNELAVVSTVVGDIRDKLKDVNEMMKNTGRSFEDVSFTIGKQSDFMIDGIKLTSDTYLEILNRAREHDKLLESSNDKIKKGNDLQKETIKLNKALLEQKKSLSAQFGFLEPGRNRKSFISGETNYFTGPEGYPFSGVINKRTSKFIHDGVMLKAWQSIQGLVESAELAYRYNLENGLDPMPTMRAYEREIEKIKSQANFVASNSAIRGYASKYSNAIASLQRAFRERAKFARFENGRYGLPVFGGSTPEDRAYTSRIQSTVDAIATAGGYKTPGEEARKRADELNRSLALKALGINNLNKYGLSIPTAKRPSLIERALQANRGMQPVISKYGSRLTQAKGKSKAGIRLNAIMASAAQRNQSYVDEVQALLGEFDLIESLLAPLAQFGVDMSLERTAISGIKTPVWAMSLPRFNPKGQAALAFLVNKYWYNKNVYEPSVRAYESQMGSVRGTFGSEISRIFSPIGLTTYKDITNVLNNPLISDDIDNMLRYNARLAQISTGATII